MNGEIVVEKEPKKGMSKHEGGNLFFDGQTVVSAKKDSPTISCTQKKAASVVNCFPLQNRCHTKVFCGCRGA